MRRYSVRGTAYATPNHLVVRRQFEVPFPVVSVPLLTGHHPREGARFLAPSLRQPGAAAPTHSAVPVRVFGYSPSADPESEPVKSAAGGVHFQRIASRRQPEMQLLRQQIPIARPVGES